MVVENVRILRKENIDFPWRLRILEDCPDVIYVMGNQRILNDFSIAVVGSRKCDEYGRIVTEKFSSELAASNVCIISGLAEGIDTIAHQSALKVKGKTIAVLGGGFEKIFPESNIELFHDIVCFGGAVISEYPPDEIPKSMNFPRRNRIVACMSDGTLVTQARAKSGALITANIAKKYNRKLFTIPANLENRNSEGTIQLIKQNAKIVFEVEDVLEEFKYYKYAPKEIEKTSGEKKIPEKYQEIYSVLRKETLQANEICRKTGKSIGQVLVDLTMMEMQGYIKQAPGGRYITI